MKIDKVKFVITNGSSVLGTVVLDLFYVNRHEDDKITHAKRGLATAYNVESKHIFVDQTYNQKLEG